MNKFKGVLEQSGIFSKLVVLFGIICFFAIILTPLSAIITFSNASSVYLLKIYQLLLSIGMFVIPPLILAFLCSKKPMGYLHLDKKVRFTDGLFIILFMLIIIPFINLLGDFNHQLVLPKVLGGVENWIKVNENQASKLVDEMLQVHGFNALLFNIFLIAIIPALGEELFFRGALIGIFKDWKGMIPAIWLTAVIFSAIHMQFYGFIPRLLMGAFFGYLLLWSENLWLPIIAHFINNIVAVVLYYLKFNGYKLPDIDSIGVGNTLWMGLASGAIGIFGVFWFKRRLLLRIENN